MQTNTLRRTTPRISVPRVGRGGKRGKTSGHGTKGQKGRAGRKMRPELRNIIIRFPKRRGYGKNRGKTHVYNEPSFTITLARLQKIFPNGGEVNPKTIVATGIISTRQARLRHIAILGGGSLSAKCEVTKCRVSEVAKTAIEKAGGSVTPIS